MQHCSMAAFLLVLHCDVIALMPASHSAVQVIQFDHAPPKGAGITEVKRSCPDYFL